MKKRQPKKRQPKKRQSKPSAPAQPSSAIVKANKAQTAVLSAPEKLEQVLIVGDLATLTPIERVDYYKRVCDSLGINHLTRPFEYILFKEYDSNAPAKLSLYARKDCTEQLRRIHQVSVIPPLRKSITDDYCSVEADLRSASGKTDTATGVVALFKIKDGRRIALEGVQYANAIMRAETKAKRRGTLSICGLGILDESELDGVQMVGGVTPEGRIWYRDDYDPEEGHKKGREAAGKVLEEKLSGKRPLHEKPRENDPEPSITPDLTRTSDIPPAKVEPMGEVASAKWVVTLDWTNETAPILTADAEAIEVLKDAQALGLTWGKDEFWHLPPRNAEKLREMAKQFPFQLQEIVPKVSGEQRGEQPEKTTRPAESKESGSAEPLVVKGTLQHFTEKMTSGSAKRPSAPYLSVLLKTADGDKWASCFDRTLFDFVSAGKGKPGEFLITRNGNYLNLVGFRKLGSKEFDTDGKTPVIQRKDQQAGGSLFGQ